MSRERKHRLRLTVLTLAFCQSVAAVPQNKPPNCYSNLQLPNGSKDANGKTIINISVLTTSNYGWQDSSGNVNSSISSAITCAIGLWTAQGGSNGQGIPYSFNIVAPNTGSADVIVNKDSTPGSPVAITSHPATTVSNNVQQYGQPATLTINPSAPSIDTTLCATVAHELGHVMGLADAQSGSIMGPVVGQPGPNGEPPSSWTNATQKVQKGDVNNVQFAATNQSQCNDLAKAKDTENDPAQCTGSAPNDSCFCDGTSLTYQCACDGSPTTCSDGTPAICDNYQWECASVTTSQCDGALPCPEAVCNGDNSWDTSNCVSVTTSQCDGNPPCASAVCSADNTWDISSCGCTDVCNSSCVNYDATACACQSNGCYSTACPGYDDLACNCPNNECYSESCSNFDYCTCYPDECGPTCDPYADMCDPNSCFYNEWECFWECECDDYCDDLTTIKLMPNASPAPIDADPNVVTPQQKAAPLIRPQPMCDGRPTLKDPHVVDPGATYFTAYRTQEDLTEWRIG